MIQSSELRIGNLLHYWRSGIAYEIIVESIDNEGINYQKDVYEIDEYSSLLGIPLTEEWLIKAGFEKWNKPSNNLHLDAWQVPMSARFDIDWIDGKLYLKSRYDQEKLEVQHMPQIKYVHQLQNLYWCLVGQELEFIS